MDRRRGLTVGAPASCRSMHPQSKYVCKGKDRAAFVGGPKSREETPRGGGATWRPALRTEGTGLFNLMRNIGASIGISMMSYLLVRNSAITQAGLVEHVTPYRQVVRDHAQH